MARPGGQRLLETSGDGGPTVLKTTGHSLVIVATLLAVGSLLMLGYSAVARAAGEPEDELKAAVVLSFLRYTEWPASGSRVPIVVGVLGRKQFGETLSRTLDGKLAGSRAIRTVTLQATPSLGCCEYIYFATGRIPDPKLLAALARDGHAVTIGEDDRFLDSGGVVNLLMVDGHMSFEISLPALESTGYTISSKLLRFGRIRLRKGERL